MSRAVTPTSGDVRDVNNTCNVLHVPRSAKLSSSSVLSDILVAQRLLATGTALPETGLPNDPNVAFGGQLGPVWLGGESSDVVACIWSKDIEGVVGTLSVQLKPRAQYLETILPGDLLFIFMDDAGNYDPSARLSGTFVTVVIVDRIAELTHVEQGATVSVINVTARDLAVIFSESTTVFDQAFAQLENSFFTGEYIRRLLVDHKQLALSPLENVLLLILLLYDSDKTGSKFVGTQWIMSASSNELDITPLISLLDVTTYVQNPIPFYSMAEPYAIVQAGNVWSLIESYSNPLINEFFIDIRDDSAQEHNFIKLTSKNAAETFFANNVGDLNNQAAAIQAMNDSNIFRTSPKVSGRGGSTPALVFRQRPYDVDAFDALPVTEVDITEVMTFEVARSSHDVFNWFRVSFPNFQVIFQELVKGVRVVPQSIAKFGIRRLEAETRYLFTSSEAAITFSKDRTKVDFGDVFGAYIDLLSEWHGQNEFWYAGQMTMRFRPSIRIGTRLRLRRRGQLYDYYVQGVHHSFSKEPGASQTSLTLTRGRNVSSATIPVVPTADFQHDGLSVSEPPAEPPPLIFIPELR